MADYTPNKSEFRGDRTAFIKNNGMTSFPAFLRKLVQQYDAAVVEVMCEWQPECRCHSSATDSQAEPGNESLIPLPITGSEGVGEQGGKGTREADDFSPLPLSPIPYPLADRPPPNTYYPCPRCPYTADFEQRVAQKIQELTPK